MSALKAIYAAVGATLAADTTLTALLAPSILDGGSAVFNDVPENQAYPHIDIGTNAASERAWNTFGGADVGIGFDDKVPVHIWSQAQGDLESLTILNRVMALLHFRAVTVTGFPTVLCELENTRCLIEQADKLETRHVIATFRFRVS